MYVLATRTKFILSFRTTNFSLKADKILLVKLKNKFTMKLIEIVQ